MYCFNIMQYGKSRSQCPRGLRHGSAAARLLGLRVRIPPGAWISGCCELCVLSGRCLCVGWSIVQRSPTARARACVCVYESSIMRRPWPSGGGPLRHGKKIIWREICNKINLPMPWTNTQPSVPSFSNECGCLLSISTLLNEAVQYVACFWGQFLIPDLGLVCLKTVYVIFFTEEAPSWCGGHTSYMAVCQHTCNLCISY